MAITKTDFYAQSLNQFAPHRVRGEYLDWGLNAEVIEVEIDASVETPLYAGDAVKIVSTSTGKPKVVACEAGDMAYGFILYNAKRIAWKAGDRVSVLRDGGVINEVTEGEIAAGSFVYWNASDGSVAATGTGLPMGIALNAVDGTSSATFVAVEVMKPAAGLAAISAVIPSDATSTNKLLDKATADATYAAK